MLFTNKPTSSVIYKLQWKASNASVMDVLASLYKDCQFLAQCWINIQYTHVIFNDKSGSVLRLHICECGKRCLTHYYVVANGNKMFTALLDNSGYSVSAQPKS